MKTVAVKAVMLMLVLCGFSGCSESPKAYPFGPIPHDKAADGGGEQPE